MSAVSLIESDFDVINYEAGADSNLRGMECVGCRRLLEYKFFDRNSSYKSGYDPMCPLCKSSPRLSIAEHTSRLREMNYSSEATKRQRHPDQAELRKPRRGKSMSTSEFLTKLHKAYPGLFITEGGIAGDVALYATSGWLRHDWNDRDFKYIGYVTLPKFYGDDLPEYSEYEFDSRDIMLRVSKIGWRSVLIRFIENDIIPEEKINEVFGRPLGDLHNSWFKALQTRRNKSR